jgi:hypothetical protein
VTPADIDQSLQSLQSLANELGVQVESFQGLAPA